MVNQNSKGFTTIELMVSIIISMVIMGSMYFTYFFGLKMTRKWREKVNLEDTAAIIMNRITKDLIFSDEIINMNNYTLKLVLNTQDRINYIFEGGHLFRNGFRITEDDVFIIDIKFEIFTKDDMDQEFQWKHIELSSLSLNGNRLKHKNKIISVQIIVSDSKKQITLRSAVGPRNDYKVVFRDL